eukprot:snap_masked-scaffold_33-processed-gene-3.39-mRNA-1 protein AED:1.00 eAED:1.00 QI:0/-1/0/0/-1/1/1/0/913
MKAYSKSSRRKCLSARVSIKETQRAEFRKILLQTATLTSRTESVRASHFSVDERAEAAIRELTSKHNQCKVEFEYADNQRTLMLIQLLAGEEIDPAVLNQWFFSQVQSNSGDENHDFISKLVDQINDSVLLQTLLEKSEIRSFPNDLAIALSFQTLASLSTVDPDRSFIYKSLFLHFFSGCYRVQQKYIKQIIQELCKNPEVVLETICKEFRFNAYSHTYLEKISVNKQLERKNNELRNSLFHVKERKQTLEKKMAKIDKNGNQSDTNENNKEQKQNQEEVSNDLILEMMWISPTIFKEAFKKKPEIPGKIFGVYTSFLSEIHKDEKKKHFIEFHEAVLGRLVNTVSHIKPDFLERLLLRNRYLLRNILESSDVGRDVLSSISTSSVEIVETVILADQEKVSFVLQKNLDWLNKLLLENPILLLKLCKSYPGTLRKIFKHDADALVSLFEALPDLLQIIIKAIPQIITSELVDDEVVVFPALQKFTHSKLVKMFIRYPQTLLENNELLQDLNLLNVDKYILEQSQEKSTQTKNTSISSSSFSGQVKLRSLIEISGKKKLKTAGIFTEEKTLEIIFSVYTQKLQTDDIDKRAGQPTDPLPEVVLEYFSAQDFTKHRKKAAALVNSVKKFAGSNRCIYWFGIMTGCIQTDYFTIKSSELFFTIVSKLIPTRAPFDNSKFNGLVVPLKEALSRVKTALDMVWEADDQNLRFITDHMNNLQKVPILEKKLYPGKGGWAYVNADLEVMNFQPTGEIAVKSILSKPKNERTERNLKLVIRKTTGMMNALKFLKQSGQISEQKTDPDVECIFLKDVIDIVLTFWSEREQSNVDSLIALYKVADTNGDGTLDLEEFTNLVLRVSQKCDNRTIRRMFRLTGEGTDTGEQTITPLEFVEVMRNNNLDRIDPEQTIKALNDSIK